MSGSVAQWYFLRDGVVFECTEWATCNGMTGSADSHTASGKVKFGAASMASTGAKAKGQGHGTGHPGPGPRGPGPGGRRRKAGRRRC